VAANKTSTIHGIKGKRTIAEKKPAVKSHPAGNGDEVITVDRRNSGGRRLSGDRRVENMPVAAERRVLQRRVKVSRRRQIDPTTCEREYTIDEIEFMGAMDAYKRRSGRMFPTCSEVLEVIKSLGYEKCPAPEPAILPPIEPAFITTAIPIPV
jgi:hypothetical protein